LDNKLPIFVVLVSKKSARLLNMKVLSIGTGKLICKHFIVEAGAIRKILVLQQWANSQSAGDGC